MYETIVNKAGTFRRFYLMFKGDVLLLFSPSLFTIKAKSIAAEPGGTTAYTLPNRTELESFLTVELFASMAEKSFCCRFKSCMYSAIILIIHDVTESDDKLQLK